MDLHGMLWHTVLACSMAEGLSVAKPQDVPESTCQCMMSPCAQNVKYACSRAAEPNVSDALRSECVLRVYHVVAILLVA